MTRTPLWLCVWAEQEAAVSADRLASKKKKADGAGALQAVRLKNNHEKETCAVTEGYGAESDGVAAA